MQSDTNQTKNPSAQAINSAANAPVITPAYNGVDRNAWIFGWNPQQELWNGRLAMIGFVAYLLWDLAGYSVLRNALHWMR